MKKTNKILSLAMAMLIAIISVVCISADDVIINDEYIAFFENGIATDEFEEELMPLAAGGCSETLYINNSLAVDDFSYPNSTIYYTSNGQASGTIYSIIYTNEFGGTTVRHDISSYNGGTLKHGLIIGPHTHRYRWWVYNGINRYKEESITPYYG